MNITITSDYEVMEVLRAFPVLKRTLSSELHFNLNEIHSNDTIASFFRRQSLSNEEIRIVLRKMNHKLKTFFEAPIVYPTQTATVYDQDALDEEE